MNTKWLASFVAVYECQSISEAGRCLGIGQPAVTKHLINLESYLGTTLFTNKTAPTKLNSAGLHVLPIARSILRLLKEVTTELSTTDSHSRSLLGNSARR